MFKLAKYLKGYRAKTIIGPFFKLFEAFFELITPLVVAWVIDTAIPRGRSGDFSGLWIGGGIILALGVLGLAFTITAQFFASRASAGFGTNLRRELYHHINTFSYAELDKFSTTSLITRLTSDVNQAQQAVAMFIRLILRAPFISVGAIVMAMIIDLKISLIFVVSALVIGGALWLIMSLTMPGYKRVQEKLDEVTRLTKENLSGARVVRAFDAETREISAFDAAADVLSRTSIKVSSLSALLNPLTYAVLNIGVIVLLYFGGVSVNAGKLTQGEIIALVNYMTQILTAMIVFANLLVTFTKASASAARINEVFDVTTSMEEGSGASPDLDANAIELNDVTFTYSGSSAPSLSDVNLKIAKGMSVGILGGTGSGKSTLIDLVCRFYDADNGGVTLFDHDVKQYSFAQLRGMVGIVPQQAVLFTGTIRDNMQWAAPGATDEEIWQALEIAQAAEFVRGKPGMLDAPVETAGRNFSGGQRQRLTIARALVPKPKILILDDSASALDFATDAALRKAIKEETSGMTVFIVSQRAASVQRADHILVLDDGKLVGDAPHAELLQSCEVYKEICLSQLSKEEVAKTL